MIYEVKITTPAKNDLRGIHRYIANEYNNPTAADRRVSLIHSKLKSLDSNPARFALAREDYLASKGVRTLTVKTQIAFYIIDENAKVVHVIRIMHGRRDWMNILKEEIDDLIEDFTTE